MQMKRVMPWRAYKHWRRLSAPMRMLPHYIIIGAQKCGTDSLSTYLNTHPQVVPGTHKEIFFFSDHYHEGLSWYKAYFPLSSPFQQRGKSELKKFITGEATPDYLFHPNAAGRLARTLPNVRLIVLLRDPVVRAYSHYHHSVRWKFEKLSFSEAIASESRRLEGELARMRAEPTYASPKFRRYSYISRGLYLEQLRRYYDVFDPQQIMVLKSEDFFAETQTVFDEITHFLGLEPHKLNDIKARNTGSYSKSMATAEPELARELYNYFRPYNEKLYRYLKMDFNWEANDPRARRDLGNDNEAT